MKPQLTTSQLISLIDAGLTTAQLRLVIRLLSQAKPDSDAERPARTRARRKAVTPPITPPITPNVTCSVTRDVTKPDPSPLGPPSFPHTPYHPPIIPPTPVDEGGDGRDALGWPSVQTQWVDTLINETGCADPVRDIWPRATASVLLGWHEMDRFEWRDVTAGIRRVMAKAPDPPSSWRYFARAIARTRQDRTHRTPEPVNDQPFRAPPENRPSRSTAYLVAAVNRARQCRDG